MNTNQNTFPWKWVWLGIGVMLLVTSCGQYNSLTKSDQSVKAAWSEVVNQYQRRADLVPNIVATVKGEAKFEQETLTKVVEARAKATSIQVTPETLNNPEAFKKFQAAQGELGSALSRLMVVSERYPDLKANRAFSDLRVTLEGTENRIGIARKRYIDTIRTYNTDVLQMPGAIIARIAGFNERPNFTVENEAKIKNAPEVNFGEK